jgi:hypothetical protein
LRGREYDLLVESLDLVSARTRPKDRPEHRSLLVCEVDSGEFGTERLHLVRRERLIGHGYLLTVALVRKDGAR